MSVLTLPLAASMVGSVTGLVVMGFCAIAVIVIVLGANLWLRWQRSRNRPEKVDEGAVESSPAYRRYLVAAAWAGGSERNWDHSVRPVLAELVELSVAEQRYAGGDLREAARERLGELWPLVDRDAPRSHDRSAPGAGREALVQILDRVERQ